jgi:hypothetical protein
MDGAAAQRIDVTNMNGNGQHGAVFLALLGRCRGAWRRSLVFALALRIVGWAVVAATLCFVADFFLALDEAVRFGLAAAVPLGLLAAAAPEARRIARTGLGETAARADRAGRHRRNEVLTAWELSGADGGGAAGPTDPGEPGAGGMTAFLKRRSLEDAVARLQELDPRALRPDDALKRRGRVLGLQALAALAAVLVCGGEAFLTVAPRLLWPGRDIPPYSRYRFEVEPETLSILYGGTAEVAATVSGAPVDRQVWLMTRRGRRESRRVACFQDGGGRYAQRLERVTVSVEFCFGVGRARSRWHRVSVQLQPQIVLARVRLAAPAYTRLPVREFAAGQEEIEGVRGTRAVLTLTSNRPLKEGALVLRRRSAARDGEQVVAGRLVSERSVAFEWTLEDDASLQAVLRDVQGTPTAEPLVLRQKRLPDEAPSVALSEPPEFSLATPGAVVKVVGHAEDDFGVEQLDWVRTVEGFNDRAVTLRRDAAGGRAELDLELRLGELGVEPGQLLEFYAEALDNNPYQAGVGASGITRVKVISEADYAEILRNQETLQQFYARYAAVDATLQQLIGWLEELKTLTAQKPGRDTLAAGIRKSVTAHLAAEALFQQIARDFALYDIEQTLRQTADGVAGRLGENRFELEAMLRQPGADAAERIEGMVARLKDDAGAIGKQRADAERIDRIGKVLDAAAQFSALVQRQEELVRRLKQRYGAKAAASELPFLPGYGEEQAGLAQALRKWMDDAKAAAEGLPDEDGKLKEDALLFVRDVAGAGAETHMGLAVQASANSDAARAGREAQLALEKLAGLVKKGGAADDSLFKGLFRGDSPQFGPEHVRKTLQEMFRSLCRKRGVAGGQGRGAGRGNGFGEMGNGSGGDGYSELATPVYGPERSRLGSGAGARGAGGSGPGDGAGRAGRGAAVVERAGSAEARAPSGEAVPFERLPVKYRDAVKRYFQKDAEGGVK